MYLLPTSHECHMPVLWGDNHVTALIAERAETSANVSVSEVITCCPCPSEIIALY